MDVSSGECILAHSSGIKRVLPRVCLGLRARASCSSGSTGGGSYSGARSSGASSPGTSSPGASSSADEAIVGYIFL